MTLTYWYSRRCTLTKADKMKRCYLECPKLQLMNGSLVCRGGYMETVGKNDKL